MDLYLVTNRNLLADAVPLVQVIEQAVQGGVDAVILREKDLSADELLRLAQQIKKVIAGQSVKLIINNHLQVARAIEADGYHTGYKNYINHPPLFNGFKGISVHSPDEAVIAEKKGADYLLAGHIFATDCKKGLEPKGIRMLKDIKSSVNIPVIALGGINPGNAEQVYAAGADGIAVMSYIMKADDPCQAAKQLKNRSTC